MRHVRFGSCCLILAFLLVHTQYACDRQQPLPPAKPPTVTIAQPIVQPYQPHEDFTGNVVASESVDIRARVSGYLDKVFFDVGTEVKAGNPLFQIDPRPFQAEVDRAKAMLATAEVQFNQADIEYRRLKDLFEKESASQLEFDRHQSLRAAAEADMMAARAALDRAQLDLDYAFIRAPLSGRISRTLVDPGNLIQGGAGMATLLTNIVAMDPIHVYFDIDELTLLRLSRQREHREHRQEGAKGVPVYLGLADETGYPHRGEIDFIDNRVDPNTGTLRVRAAFANPDRLLYPGLFVRVRVHTGPPADAIMIAERALGQDQAQRFVFVVNDQNAVEYRRVDIGPLEDKLRVIEGGIGPQEWIVVSGLLRVRPGAVVATEKADMLRIIGVSDRSIASEPITSTDTAASQPSSSH